jgi:hypothetical protein
VSEAGVAHYPYASNWNSDRHTGARRAWWGGDSVLDVGLDSAKDDADALQGVKCLAEALVPWLTGVLPPGADGGAGWCGRCRSGLFDSVPPRHLGERGLQVAA